jgi:hypothetical protein
MDASTSWTSAGRDAGRRIEEAVERMAVELQGAIAYVDRNVVPPVRRESITAMRTIAGTLRDMADRMEKAAAKGPQR